MAVSHFKSLSDEELWCKLKKGNKEALRTLFLRHHDSLYQYGLAICSKRPVIDDCLQDLFFYLWKQHAHLYEVQNVKGYLWISYRRRLMKGLKEKRSEQNRFTPFTSGMKKESPLDQSIIQQEQEINNREILNQVVDNLTQREREVLFLKYYEGMTYPEIEEILGVEYQTARNYIYRAIKRLRKVLEEKDLRIVFLVIFMLLL